MQRLAILVFLLCCAGAAAAQVPNLPLPTLPSAPSLPETLQQTRQTLRELREARRVHLRDLLRRHRDALETDPFGAVIVRNEVIAWSPTPEALARAAQAGFSVTAESALEGLDARIVVLRAPQGASTRRALETLRQLDPGGVYDYNHLYTDSGAEDAAKQSGTLGAGGGLVGLIDAGVDVAHRSLAGARVETRGFAGPARASPHGTAVASILVGRSDGLQGAAPGAALFAADVYCGVPTGGSTDAIVRALAWMARERVAVVNVSLVGPRNATLEAAVRAMIARGHVIVAAVGNDGPAAPPLYPASYDGVVGVTGVDARRRALLEAGRGSQVDFAAPGADMAAANPGGGYAAVRGTSYAAPIVAGLLARRLSNPDPAAARQAIAALSGAASDLGARGRDDTYGAGLVGADLRPALTLVRR